MSHSVRRGSQRLTRLRGEDGWHMSATSQRSCQSWGQPRDESFEALLCVAGASGSSGRPAPFALHSSGTRSSRPRILTRADPAEIPTCEGARLAHHPDSTTDAVYESAAGSRRPATSRLSESPDPQVLLAERTVVAHVPVGGDCWQHPSRVAAIPSKEWSRPTRCHPRRRARRLSSSSKRCYDWSRGGEVGRGSNETERI